MMTVASSRDNDVFPLCGKEYVGGRDVPTLVFCGNVRLPSAVLRRPGTVTCEYDSVLVLVSSARVL